MNKKLLIFIHFQVIHFLKSSHKPLCKINIFYFYLTIPCNARVSNYCSIMWNTCPSSFNMMLGRALTWAVILVGSFKPFEFYHTTHWHNIMFVLFWQKNFLAFLIFGIMENARTLTSAFSLSLSLLSHQTHFYC